MDELRFSRRMRRLALFAAINCTAIASTATVSLADDLRQPPAEKSLRSLLKEGWNQSPATPSITLPKLNLSEVQPPKQLAISSLSSTVNKLKSATRKTNREQQDDDTVVLPQRQLTPLKVDIAKALPALTASRPMPSVKKPLSSTPKPRTVTPKTISAPLAQKGTPPRLLRNLQDNNLKIEMRLPKPAELPVAKSKPPASPPVDSQILIDNSIKDLKQQALRSIAREQGFGLFGDPAAPANPPATRPLRDQTSKPSVAVAPPPVPPAATLMSAVHANKLRELSQTQLKQSADRLRRGATHSAKQLATQALQNIVAIRDLQDGGNAHAAQLESAFIAIRESADFGGKFGAINHGSLKRLVAVHKTDVLKGKDLSNVSALQAMDDYLAAAHDQLVFATGSIRAASDALVLLGRVEQQMSSSSTQNSAVAVTLQSAAVSSDNTNAIAFYDLGTNLLRQGLPTQAKRALQRSVDLSPNRRAYENLKKAAQATRDQGTFDACMVALRNPNLRTLSPVRRLDPKAFAATHRPETMQARNTSPSQRSAASSMAATKSIESPKQVKAQPVSAKIKQALRRSWLLPKSR